MRDRFKYDLYAWLQFLIWMVLIYLLLSLLSSCKCGYIKHNSLVFLGCGIGTEPLTAVVSEPNRLSVNYYSVPQETEILTPYGAVQTKKGD